MDAFKNGGCPRPFLAIVLAPTGDTRGTAWHDSVSMRFGCRNLKLQIGLDKHCLTLSGYHYLSPESSQVYISGYCGDPKGHAMRRTIRTQPARLEPQSVVSAVSEELTSQKGKGNQRAKPPRSLGSSGSKGVLSLRKHCCRRYNPTLTRSNTCNP
eukprot:942728-Rhodomonas_salina.1